MYYNQKINFEESHFEKSSAKFKDSLSIARTKLAEADYFSLDMNEKAQSYFDTENSKNTLTYDKLIPVIKERLMDLNSNPKGNPYVGQDQIGAQKFIINKVRILNHRWIIADYSDGEYWGEVLLKYFVNDDKTLSFETIESILYQK